MSRVLDELHQDHINVALLLDLIDEQLAVLEQRGDADYARLADIMRYMTEYPDIVHHPREEVVFKKMLARDHAARAIIEDLMEEHRRLAVASTRALQALCDAGTDATATRTEIATSLANYVNLLREHMNKEESKVFPLAKIVLTPRDFAEIDAAHDAAGDPLFGESIAHSYASLFEFILKQRPEVRSAS